MDDKGKGSLKTPTKAHIDDPEGKAPKDDKDKGPLKSPIKDMFEDEIEDEDAVEIPEDSDKAHGRSGRKAQAMTKLQVGDFIAIRINKMCRTSGDNLRRASWFQRLKALT